MNRDARVLVRVFSILGRDGDFLGSHGLSGVYVTGLEDYSCISKYEVHCSVYITFTIELAVGVYIQRVLVTSYFAPVDHSVVRADAESHSLVLAGSRIILKRHVPGNESAARSRCRPKKEKK